MEEREGHKQVNCEGKGLCGKSAFTIYAICVTLGNCHQRGSMRLKNCDFISINHVFVLVEKTSENVRRSFWILISLKWNRWIETEINVWVCKNSLCQFEKEIALFERLQPTLLCLANYDNQLSGGIKVMKWVYSYFLLAYGIKCLFKAGFSLMHFASYRQNFCQWEFENQIEANYLHLISKIVAFNIHFPK